MKRKTASELADLMFLQLHKKAQGKFELPADHKPAMEVPKGGSCCANCQYGKEVDGKPYCTNDYFIKWHGTSRLPVDDPTTYCSDWYQPEAGSE